MSKKIKFDKKSFYIAFYSVLGLCLTFSVPLIAPFITNRSKKIPITQTSVVATVANTGVSLRVINEVLEINNLSPPKIDLACVHFELETGQSKRIPLIENQCDVFMSGQDANALTPSGSSRPGRRHSSDESAQSNVNDAAYNARQAARLRRGGINRSHQERLEASLQAHDRQTRREKANTFSSAPSSPQSSAQPASELEPLLRVEPSPSTGVELNTLTASSSDLPPIFDYFQARGRQGRILLEGNKTVLDNSTSTGQQSDSSVFETSSSTFNNRQPIHILSRPLSTLGPIPSSSTDFTAFPQNFNDPRLTLEGFKDHFSTPSAEDPGVLVSSPSEDKPLWGTFLNLGSIQHPMMRHVAERYNEYILNKHVFNQAHENWKRSGDELQTAIDNNSSDLQLKKDAYDTALKNLKKAHEYHGSLRTRFTSCVKVVNFLIVTNGQIPKNVLDAKSDSPIFTDAMTLQQQYQSPLSQQLLQTWQNSENRRQLISGLQQNFNAYAQETIFIEGSQSNQNALNEVAYHDASRRSTLSIENFDEPSLIEAQLQLAEVYEQATKTEKKFSKKQKSMWIAADAVEIASGRKDQQAQEHWGKMTPTNRQIVVNFINNYFSNQMNADQHKKPTDFALGEAFSLRNYTGDLDVDICMLLGANTQTRTSWGINMPAIGYNISDPYVQSYINRYTRGAGVVFTGEYASCSEPANIHHWRIFHESGLNKALNHRVVPRTEHSLLHTARIAQRIRDGKVILAADTRPGGHEQAFIQDYSR